MGTPRIGARGLTTLACLLTATSLVACQPLYGNKPDKLANPTRKKKPPEPPEQTAQIKYIEECEAKFREDPKNVRQETSRANSLLADGETAMNQAQKAQDPAAQAELIKVAISKFREALMKDPYHAEATKQLAIAYDAVLRKGCALALLKRIQSLQANQRFARSANAAADDVVDNKQWFKGYRKDAESAVGR